MSMFRYVAYSASPKPLPA